MPGKCTKNIKSTTKSNPIKRTRLRTARDVARYIARQLKKTDEGPGGIDINLAYKRAMICSILIKAIDTAELEDRIKKLEKALERKDNESK